MLNYRRMPGIQNCEVLIGKTEQARRFALFASGSEAINSLYACLGFPRYGSLNPAAIASRLAFGR